MKILIVEDDAKIAHLIQKGLHQAGFAVDVVSDGKAGMAHAERHAYDAMIIDLMLPGLDGLSVIEQLRAQGDRTPILILSARRSVDERVSGLRAGGDDYLVKPFSFAELLARVQALVRRATPVAEPTRLVSGDIIMDLLKREVTRAGRRIDLRPREFSLLEYFLRHPGQVLSKTVLMERLWEFDFDPQTNVVDVLVCRLRNKVDRGFDKKFVHTLRGVGYALKTS